MKKPLIEIKRGLSLSYPLYLTYLGTSCRYTCRIRYSEYLIILNSNFSEILHYIIWYFSDSIKQKFLFWKLNKKRLKIQKMSLVPKRLNDESRKLISKADYQNEHFYKICSTLDNSAWKILFPKLRKIGPLSYLYSLTNEFPNLIRKASCQTKSIYNICSKSYYSEN